MRLNFKYILIFNTLKTINIIRFKTKNKEHKIGCKSPVKTVKDRQTLHALSFIQSYSVVKVR